MQANNRLILGCALLVIAFTVAYYVVSAIFNGTADWGLIVLPSLIAALGVGTMFSAAHLRAHPHRRLSPARAAAHTGLYGLIALASIFLHRDEAAISSPVLMLFLGSVVIVAGMAITWLVSSIVDKAHARKASLGE